MQRTHNTISSSCRIVSQPVNAIARANHLSSKIEGFFISFQVSPSSDNPFNKQRPENRRFQRSLENSDFYKAGKTAVSIEVSKIVNFTKKFVPSSFREGNDGGSFE